jgi:hypothetical protein
MEAIRIALQAYEQEVFDVIREFERLQNVWYLENGLQRALTKLGIVISRFRPE